MNQKNTMKTLNQLAQEIHDNAKAKGFHPAEQPLALFMANQCNNLHGEVTELWDAWRAGNQWMPCDKAAKMKLPLTCTEEELADIIIRALDLSARLGLDIDACVKSKMEYNTTRPHLHGKLN